MNLELRQRIERHNKMKLNSRSMLSGVVLGDVVELSGHRFERTGLGTFIIDRGQPLSLESAVEWLTIYRRQS